MVPKGVEVESGVSHRIKDKEATAELVLGSLLFLILVFKSSQSR